MTPPCVPPPTRYRFYANFAATRSAGPSTMVVDEGPPCVTKPDGKGTVVVFNTCDSGLVVENCSGGWVRQTPAEPLAYTSSGPRELSRCVVGCYGTVVITLEDGYRKALYADGSVGWFLPDEGAAAAGEGDDEGGATAPTGKWMVVEPSGRRYVKLGGKQVTTDPVQLTRTVYVSSACVVACVSLRPRPHLVLVWVDGWTGTRTSRQP